MMIYQQTMLDTTIKPIAPTLAVSRSTSMKQRQSRSVMFSSSTKSNNASSHERSTKKRRASSSVPIPDAMFRSPSELQLSVDEQVAEERDFVFYARLVSGIRERTHCDHHQYYNEETERCLTHIMQTRHQQEHDIHEDGAPILCDEKLTENGGARGYYLEDLDCLTSSSSSYSSCSTYQQDFEQDRNDDKGDDMYDGENECIFDLEL